jgi:hypothetical protein
VAARCTERAATASRKEPLSSLPFAIEGTGLFAVAGSVSFAFLKTDDVGPDTRDDLESNLGSEPSALLPVWLHSNLPNPISTPNKGIALQHHKHSQNEIKYICKKGPLF